MSLPHVVSRQEWLVARRELLSKEKEFTRRRDALNAERRRLPMVRVEKEYAFDGVEGEASLGELFGDSRQLIVQHFMFDPAWNEGCAFCTVSADELAPGLLAHLHARDTAFAAVSRAPIAKIEAYRTLRGWTFPWYSSFGSDFNYDFHATLDESVVLPMVNYRTKAEVLEAGKPNPFAEAEEPVEVPGYSFFLREGDAVFHTYSTFARGVEAIGGGYAFLDLTALGRQEEWEEPKGRAAGAGAATPDFAS